MSTLKDYSIYNSVNQLLHLRQYGFFVLLSQVRNILSSEESMKDRNGKIISDHPNFFNTITNLRYSILFHHDASNSSKLLSNQVQNSLSVEPNDISKSLPITKKNIFFCEKMNDISQYSQISQMNQRSLLSISQDERIKDVLSYLLNPDTKSNNNLDDNDVELRSHCSTCTFNSIQSFDSFPSMNKCLNFSILKIIIFSQVF